MIIIHIGCECVDSGDCNMKSKCKYRSKYKLHNFFVGVHRFFECNFHIKLPHLICISKKWERLSGTSKCPYKRSRNYTCYDCEYICGYYLRECSNIERKNTDPKDYKYIQTEWGNKCGYFKKCSWADDYKVR